MTWQIPNWWTLLLLALAAWRIWRVLAEDYILERPREWAIDNAPHVYDFVVCPYCCGAWISIGLWLAWIWQPHWTLIAATPVAISAVVGLIAANIDPVE